MENNIYYVYVHLLDDIPFYIGYGKERRAENLWARKRRWKEYVGDRRNDVVIKYLETNLSEDKAKELEIKYQKEYRRFGYPIVGIIGNINDNEALERMSKKLKGQKRGAMPEETKEKLRQIALNRYKEGQKHPFLGCHHTQESKEKMSRIKKGKPAPNLRGEKNGMWGKKSPNAKKVDVYLDNKFVGTFDNTYDAEKFTGVSSCRNYANGSAGNHLHKKSGYSFYYREEGKKNE